MSAVVHRRPPRLPAPEYPSGELVVGSPPEVVPPGGRRWAQMMMMLPMLAGSVAMALMFAGSSRSSLAYVTGGLFGVSALGMIVASVSMSGGGNERLQMLTARRGYLRHLAQRRRQARRTILRQRAAQLHHHPAPDGLWSIAASPRLWERRPGDPDFATARIGTGPAELATPIVPPETQPIEDLDPMSAVNLRRFLTTYAVVPELPVVMALDGFTRVYVRGDPERARSLARALVCQAATFQAPDNLLVAFCVADDQRNQWEWVKWLPHALHPNRTDALGPVRLVSATLTALEATLDDVLGSRERFADRTAEGLNNGPHVVVVVDGGDTSTSDRLMMEDGLEGVTLVTLADPPPRVLDPHVLVLDVTESGMLLTTTVDGSAEAGRADVMRRAVAEALAQQISPFRLAVARRAGRPFSADLGLAELQDLGDPYLFDPSRTWTPRSTRDRLRVAIGVTPDSLPIELDLKESAQDGMGPHGLLIGATGSGKSELLRTLILSLAVTHDPEMLNFVLVDFKGGATFHRLDALPHTSAVITNLVDELPLVDRMNEALNGELLRRQELLHSAGNFSSQRDYERARATGANLEPLPSLLIVCDEFSELLSAKPDFVDVFVQIGRVGRSLGIHLLLASQRLEEGRLRGLDTHLSYRIGLRTFSAVESRIVLGDPSAYELPRSPGHGYLKFASDSLRRFRAAYVSGTYRRSAPATDDVVGADQVLPYTTQYVAVKTVKEAVRPQPDEEVPGESLLDILTERMRGRGTPAHRVWLPPLQEPTTLDAILPPVRVMSDRGLSVTDVNLYGRLHAAAGLVDRPLQQRRDPLWLDLSGGAGHMAVVGGPQSGKSLLLRTVVTSMALSNTPVEVQFYCLDFGGGGLLGLRDLPHVGGVATRLDPGQVRRTVAEASQLLAAREQAFALLGIDSMTAYRRLRAEGKVTGDGFGDLFLVIDGWGTIRSDFEEVEGALADIGTRGLSYGIHLIVAASRWMDLRPNIRDVFGTRLELRLGEPGDSALDRRTAVNVPEKMPGRGITPERLHFFAALPRVDGAPAAGTAGEGLEAVVGQIRAAWSGPPAPRVRLLPALLEYESLPLQGNEPGVVVGIAEADLGPVAIDFAADPHFLLYGDSGAGKSAFLRALARSLAERYPPRQARFVVIDYRRSLLDAVSTDHLIGYGTSAPVAQAMINEVVEVMRERLPGPELSAEQLRARNWWQGPQLFLLVDDYDLVATGQNPLSAVLDFIGHAGDIGLHLVLARRTGGAARTAFEPIMLRLRELGSPGIVMSGSRDEGVLLGNVRASAQPPGRGWLVDRQHGTRLVQLAWQPPPEFGAS